MAMRWARHLANLGRKVLHTNFWSENL